MRRGFVAAAALSVLLLTSLPARAATQVTIADYSFSPSSLTVPEGISVTWHNDGPHDHTSTEDGTLGLWDTGTLAPGGTSSAVSFQAAGVYPYHCHIHPFMTAKVRVPIVVTPSSGGTSTVFTITLAASSQSGYTFDVQKKVGSNAWAVWKTGVTSLTVTFKHSTPGTWKFRSRLHRTSNGAVSRWSPAKTITIS